MKFIVMFKVTNYELRLWWYLFVNGVTYWLITSISGHNCKYTFGLVLPIDENEKV